MTNDNKNKLTELEQTKYNRQMILDYWKEDKQRKLKKAKVFVVGAGGLGSSASIYLAAAGVGTIKICDFDLLDLSNLNRQILHIEDNIGVNKAISAKHHLQQFNKLINVEAIDKKITAKNALDLIENSDIIVDCVDNYKTRFILNEIAIEKGIPIVHGAIWGFCGQLTLIHSPETPCLRCIMTEVPFKEITPVLGATAGVIGTLQAMEAIKYLTGIGETLRAKLLLFDGEYMTFQKLNVNKNSDCPVCSCN